MARTDILNRVNGRSALDYRPIYLQVDIIPNASGSALIECGNTKIVCAVHGPRQVRGRQYSGKAELNVQFQMAPFSLRQRQKPGKDTEKSGPASLIQQALLPAVRLELLPKSSIDVYVTVLDSDTSELGYSSLGVTAASAALAQAGVEMLGFVTGSTASLMYSLPVNGATHQQWLVDPSQSEAIHSSTHLMICTMPALGRTTCYTLQGPVQQVSSIKEA
ncbi:hypothetical protein Malapachy_2650 [Malassezia pachydermatis]|uniref:Exoribonuclease phosphorolytic domain-containing protein n=1 Tax=Malassezia pachydermatis TaxID=77020 RepID=A0A0M9VQC4_9BASI|nr:hypothetical protein Malapachy_2650 [Malassezia pachydermatis]KOS15383.1 hypothetical protein Malapachy_2650 [Malassezia pachydermatis]